MPTRPRLILERARAFLDAAERDAHGEPDSHGRSVAYSNARTAAELAGKAMLDGAHGTFPKKHHIGGALYRSGFVPPGVDVVDLNSLLSDHTKGEYGFFDVVTQEELDQALGIARQLVAHADETLPHS